MWKSLCVSPVLNLEACPGSTPLLAHCQLDRLQPTDYSSHHIASTSEAQMFSRSWLRESMACPVKEAAYSMLANTCFYSCFASGSISLHPHSYGIEENILIKLVGSQPLTVKLSGSHMALAGDEERTCTWWSCWVLLKPDGSCGGGCFWQMDRYGTLNV